MDRDAAIARLAELLAHGPADDWAKTDLAARLAEPWRHHGPGHPALPWRRHLEFGSAAGMRGHPADMLAASAVAVHDAVADRGSAGREARSARLWRQRAHRATLSHGFARWVALTIEATDHQADGPPANALRAWVVDLDLTPLGETSSRFGHDNAMLRLEAAAAGQAPALEDARRAFLRRIAARPTTYASATLEAAFRAQARNDMRTAGAGHDEAMPA